MVGRVDNIDPSVMQFTTKRKPQWQRMERTIRRLLLVVIPLLFLILFYLLPTVEIFQKSLAGVRWDESASRSREIIARTFGFTVWQAFLSTIITLVIGLPTAYVLYKLQFFGRVFFRTITSIPFILPTVVVAAGINALIGPRGWANLLLQQVFNLDFPPIQWIGTLSAIVIAHVFYNLTIVIRLVGSSWSSLNPRLDVVAKTLGANPIQVFWHVTLPLLRPVLAASAILVFLFDFTSFGVILLLGGPGFATLEVEVYTQAMSLFNLPLASLLALIQMACTVVLTLVYQFFSTRPVPLVPLSENEIQIKPANWYQKTLIIITVLIILILILAPLVSLAARSLVRIDADRGQRETVDSGFTLDYYLALSTNPRQDVFYIPPLTAILNSVKYGVITSISSLLLGLMIVYGFNPRQRGGKIIDTLLMIPLGTSAVTLGLGYLIFFNKPPFLWGDSQWIIPMAHTLVALPFIVRGLVPAVSSIPSSIRQSASVLGASCWKVVWLVDLPTIKGALLSSLIFAFTISLGEFGATSFLARPDYPTIPIAIYRFLSQPGGLNFGQAMAMGTILMVVCATGILLIEKSMFAIAEKVE